MSRKPTVQQLVDAGLGAREAETMLSRVMGHLTSLSPSECWRALTRDVLCADHPFELHKLLHSVVFRDWDPNRGPAPAWTPSDTEVRRANVTRLMHALDVESYEELHRWSVRRRADYWEKAIRELGIRFQRAPTRILDLAHGVEAPEWLVDAELNMVDSCFGAEEDAPAIVYQPESGALGTMTYGSLRCLVGRIAKSLADAGFTPRDAIAIDMPMTVEAIAIYLGVIKAGCVVVSIADSFAPHEIETRLRLADARAIFTQDYIPRAGKRLPLYEKIIAANAPPAVVLSAPGAAGEELGDATPLRDGDRTWEAFLGDSDDFTSVACRPGDHANILFSSGTTGEPKAIPWTHTTPIKCAADGLLHQDIHPGDLVAWPTSIGWMMGPWLIYATLVNKATMALFYGPPTGREFGQFVERAQVTMLGVVPSLVRAWRDSGCLAGLDWSAIRAFSSTGECSNAEDMLFLMSRAGYRPVIEYCGGTEIGGAYIAGTVVQPTAPATFTTPTLGLDLTIRDQDGREADTGDVFLVPPSIGLSTELLSGDHHEVYHEGTPSGRDGEPLRRHGDQLERLPGGYFRIHGRVDDTMNLGGIKVSSAEIERVLASVAGVRETAAIAVATPDGGPSQLVIYAVQLPDSDCCGEEVAAAMQAAIKRDLNPLFKIHDVVIVDALPRTASNKVMRRLLRDRHRAELDAEA